MPFLLSCDKIKMLKYSGDYICHLYKKKVVKPVYESIKSTDGISLETFYKRIAIFEKLKERIVQLRQDDEWNIQEVFKFDTIN